MKKFILLIFLIGFVSAVEVDFDCPDDIYVDEEFECSVEVGDGDGVYDLKVDLEGERNSALEIWTGEVWKSGYYYLIEFIEDEEDVRLRVSEEGRYDSVLKLRQGDSVKSFDVEIRVDRAREVDEDIEEEGEREILAADYADYADSVGEDNIIVLESIEPVVISLNGDSVVEDGEEEWDYVSKDGRIVDWLVYGFCLFLIFLVGVLLWERTDKY